ncbi:Mrp/NBP35 family ATP-binding protein [Vulcanisaeta souniana]|uniref:Iron-sulfur cluster carrier protein n=1 Tax=Vulcanisaeta souniana JCM 11219 TaxID=1293586 RepID=A0A830EG88_9CREN|nr:Mrp/NBP35 family ATP-binding protein [Vulcanisaeta souniana]BDR91517.1 ATP-binding protein [Vulcanisaeta souniana JCM 11219]GGI73771.1 ATP-binding protein [Vulcanisaeta souniana JCM 11219]
MPSQNSQGGTNKIKVSVQKAGPLDTGEIAQTMKSIKAKFAIMSGKGGVGKSFVTASLALGFAMRGYRVGILDADVYGPTIPKLLGLVGANLYLSEDEKIIPAEGPFGIKVVSMDFLLPTDDTAVIWRGPLVDRAIKDFLGSVVWGDLDALFIDLPPGTGDAPLTIAQTLANEMTGSIIVTAPSDVSRRIVQKTIDFSRKVKVPVTGVVENMCCFYCPDSGKTYYIFGKLIGKEMADKYGIPYLGMIPLDPRIGESNDQGEPFLMKYSTSDTARAILSIVDTIIAMYKDKLESRVEAPAKKQVRSLLKLPGEEEGDKESENS